MNLDGWHTLAATSALIDEKPEFDWFGVGTYLVLADSEALNSNSFCQQQSGLRIGVGDLTQADPATATIAVNLIKIPTRVPLAATTAMYASSALADLLGGRAGGIPVPPTTAKVTVRQETWNTFDDSGALTSPTPVNAVQAFTATKQSGGIAQPATEPTLDLAGVL